MKKSIGSGRGSVYNILLKALQTGDKYGYEICKEVEEKTNGVYILKQPSLYSGLKRLEARNEISSYWRDSDLGGRRHYYSLTDAGRKRIENSNFSWEDARDGIVDSLFEQSALDKDISSVKNDVEELKQNASSSNEDEVDEIIKSTDHLVQKQEQSENASSGDLFSSFTSYSESAPKDDNIIQDDEQNFVAETDADLSDETNEEEQQDDIQEEQENNADDEQDIDSLLRSNFEQSTQSDDAQNGNEQSDLFDFASTNLENTEDEQESSNETDQNASADFVEDSNNEQMTNEENVDGETFEEDVSEEIANKTDNINQGNNIQENAENGVEDETSTLNNVDELFKEDAPAEQNGSENANAEATNDENAKQLDLFTYSQNKPTQSEDVLEEKQELTEQTANNYDDIIENFTTKVDEQNIAKTEDVAFENASETQNIQPEQTDVSLQKNEENLDDYKKAYYGSNSFIQNSAFETPENSHSKQDLTHGESYLDSLDYSALNDYKNEISATDDNEPLQEESASQNLNDGVLNETQQIVDDDFIHSNNAKVTNAEETQSTENVENKNFNYRDIFGDMMSNGIPTKEEQTMPQNDTTPSQAEKVEATQETSSFIETPVDYNQHNYVTMPENANKVEQTPKPFVDDLPRRDTSMDVNRTFNYDKTTLSSNPYTSSYSHEENVFEKLDRMANEQAQNGYQSDYQSNYQNETQNANYGGFSNSSVDQSRQQIVAPQPPTEQIIPFDKKCSNVNNNFEVPDYQIRYYNKKSEQKVASKFISINKLNLVSTFIISILICLFTTITLICTSQKTTISPQQNAIYIVSYVVAIALLLFRFAKYLANKSKKVEKLNSNEMLYTIFVVIVLMILTLATNLFLGMTFANIIDYSASFILPICYSVVLIINPFIKKALSKMANFYN